MTEEETLVFREAIACHNHMVEVWEAIRAARAAGRGLPVPGRDVLELALRSQRLRSALAPAAVSEMDRDNLAPHHVTQELLSTMRAMLNAVDGVGRHVPAPLPDDGIPTFFRRPAPPSPA